MAREGLALLLVFFAIISTIALFAPDSGAIVKPWHDVLATTLGWGIAFAPLLLAGVALMLWMKSLPAERWMAVGGAIIVALALLGSFTWRSEAIRSPPSAAGMVGERSATASARR